MISICFFITVKFAFAVNKIGLKVTDVYYRTALACNGDLIIKYYQLIGWSHYRLTGT